jgi:uncharacterized protein (TIGR02466 family)
VKYDLIFPTVIGVEHDLLESNDLKKVIDQCYDIKNKTQKSENSWLSDRLSPYNTMQTHNIAYDNSFSFLNQTVSEKIHEYAAIQGDMGRYSCPLAWFNVYSSENFQESHNHSFPMAYSAVYYPLAPEGSGPIVIEPPSDPYINETTMDTKSNADLLWTGSTHWKYTPRSNMLIIFRSNLKHYVLPGTNSSDRISFAFNYVIDPVDYLTMFSNYKF